MTTAHANMYYYSDAITGEQMQTKMTLDMIEARLMTLRAWKRRHTRPSEKKPKHFRRWRQNLADILLCEVFMEYLKALGPDWYVIGELPGTLYSDEPGVEHDTEYEVFDSVELNCSNNLLPEGSLTVDGYCIHVFVSPEVYYAYFVTEHPDVEPRFSTHTAAMQAALNDVEKHFGPRLT